jgi:hypothetical protein
MTICTDTSLSTTLMVELSPQRFLEELGEFCGQAIEIRFDAGCNKEVPLGCQEPYRAPANLRFKKDLFRCTWAKKVITISL